MEEIVTILSTREWAIAIWSTGFFVWMLTQREIRKSLWNVIKILLGKKLRHFFLIIALYVAGITMIFYQLPFWNNIYLKDIILWLIFSGISYCVNSIIKGDAEHLKSTVKDNFRVIVIFEYFIGTFTFKFWIEMLIIPVITILILMNVVAESEEKYRRVHKLIDIVLACIGWYMLWGAANVGLKEYKELNAINTLVSFMIPIVYTILILPLEFGLEIYSDYEQVFVRMKFRDNQDKKIQRKHRWRVIRTCKLSLRKILLFRKEYVNRMYRMCKKLVDESNIRGNGHAIYQGIITEVENKINQLCVKNFNEMDTVIEDTVTAKAQSGDIDEMASLFNSVSFRDFVMTGYKQKCAITGNVIQYKSFMNLEAAHIWPRSHKGLYLPSNGIALCRDMHWAFDKGMFTIGDDFKVIVHPDVESDYLQQYNNKSLYIPENAFFRPDINNLHYHQTHIYGLFKTSGSLVKATGYYKNINMAAEDKTPYGSN